MFNSYDDAGTFLGTIKTSTDPTVLNAPTGDLHGYYDNAKARYVETYEDDRILIKPEFVELYIENPPSIGAVAFRPNVIKETDTEGVVRFKPKTKRIAANESFNNNITYNFSEKAIQEGIVENHTTNIKGIWYCILFDPSVNSIFNDNWGWSEPLEVGDIDDDLLSKGINRPGNVIETPEGIITVGKLSEYSKNNDVWMRFDTLADSETRALKLFVRNVIEGNPDDVPEDLQGKVLEIVEEITSN